MDALVFRLPWHDALAGVAMTLRAVGFVSVAPAIGAEAVPLQLRASFAILLALLLAPVVPAAPAGVDTAWLVGSELLVGLLIGFVMRLVLDVLVYAGTMAGYPTGLAMAAMMDPLGQSQVGALAMFYQIAGTLMFLALGGLRQTLAALARSYEIVPPGLAHLDANLAPTLIKMTGQVSVLGFRLAAPVLAAGLLTDLCLMLVARAVPQMNILVVGAPVRLAAGLAAIAFSLHVFAPAVAEAVDVFSRGSGHLLTALAGRG